MDVAAWWYRVGNERPTVARGCWQDESAANIRTTDVYCHEHDRLLALNVDRPPASRWIWLALLALATFGAFLLSGLLRSQMPVFAVAMGFGALAVCLPLRRYPTTWRVVLAYWLCAGFAVLLLQEADVAAHRVARLALIALVLVVATWRLHLGVRRDDPSAVTAATVLPAAVGTAALLAYALLTVNAGAWLPPLSRGIRLVPLLAGLAGWLLAGVVVLVAGLVDGFAFSVLPVDSLMRRPVAPPRRRPSGGLVEQIGATLENVALFSLYALATAGVIAVNALWFLLVVIGRRIRVTMTHARQRIVSAARAAAPAAVATLRVVVVPVILITATAWLAVVFADHVRHYLVSDGIASLAWVTATAVLANLALFLTWALLAAGESAGERAEPLRSFIHSLKVTIPHWLLLQAVGGWLVGLPGALGYGDVHVGWVTYVSTVVLVGTFGLYLVMRQRSEAAPQREAPHLIA